MSEKMDQRICIKFCVKNVIKCSKTLEMLKVAYGECTVSQESVYKWHKLFTKGREEVNDEARPGWPSTSITNENTETVKKIVMENPRITIREVPKLLNFDQKTRRMTIAQEMLNDVNDDPDLLKRVITGDESWVYGYDVESKAQFSQWKYTESPRPKKACQVRSNVKVLLTVFFDYHDVVHQEFLPQDRTVNKEYHLEVMRRLREAIQKKRLELWKKNSWLLHHNNAPAHSSLLVRNFLAKNNTVIMPQPPCSPDLASCDFFLFPRLKRLMKGRRFATIEEIKTESLKRA